jgi:hypothetical protein
MKSKPYQTFQETKRLHKWALHLKAWEKPFQTSLPSFCQLHFASKYERFGARILLCSFFCPIFINIVNFKPIQWNEVQGWIIIWMDYGCNWLTQWSHFVWRKNGLNPAAWMKWILINESIIIDWMNSMDDYVQNAMTWIFQGCKMTQLDEMSCNEWMKQSYETSCCSKWNKFHPWITINE